MYATAFLQYLNLNNSIFIYITISQLILRKKTDKNSPK